MPIRRMILTGLGAVLLILAVAAAAEKDEFAHHVSMFKFSKSPILYTEEAQHMKGISELESATRLRGLFERLDNGLDRDGEPTGDGGDGILSRAELTHRIASVQNERVHHDAVDQLKKMDKNNDLLVDAIEASVRDERLMARFKRADKNGDGWLSEADAVAFFHPHFDERMYPVLATEVAMDVDKDGDGRLTLQEIPEHHRIHPWFKRLDTDRDGYISIPEITRWFVYIRQQEVDSVVDMLLHASDEDKDGYLTPEEVEAKHYLFMGPPSKPPIRKTLKTEL